MLSLLLLAVLQAAPDAAGRDRQYAAALASARAVWESCLDDASSKWAARPEDPLTIAAGVLGRCQREEAGVRDAINAITRVLDRNRVDEIMDRERAHARERAVAKILALRPLPASQRR